VLTLALLTCFFGGRSWGFIGGARRLIWAAGCWGFGGFLGSFLDFLAGLFRCSATGFNSFSLTSFLFERMSEFTLAESYTSLARKASRLTRLVFEIVLIWLFDGMEV